MQSLGGMTRRLTRGALAGLAAAFLLAGGASAAGQPRVLAIRFGPDLEVNPVTQDYLTGELSRAASHGYDAAVILLDTPGGLSSSMKTIYQAELSAKLPVLVYVSPEGARAASAGVWIAEAADVLAMSPTANIGSSTPIDSSGQNLGSDLRRKVINDAAASLTALAQAHHRNTTWPAQAVRKASNLTAQQALRMHVIDTVAPTLTINSPSADSTMSLLFPIVLPRPPISSAPISTTLTTLATKLRPTSLPKSRAKPTRTSGSSKHTSRSRGFMLLEARYFAGLLLFHQPLAVPLNYPYEFDYR